MDGNSWLPLLTARMLENRTRPLASPARVPGSNANDRNVVAWEPYVLRSLRTSASTSSRTYVAPIERNDDGGTLTWRARDDVPFVCGIGPSVWQPRGLHRPSGAALVIMFLM